MSATDTAGREIDAFCFGRSKTTDASHCWHDSGFGGGSFGHEPDGTAVSESRGTRVCCWCGAQKPYHIRISTAPSFHGPYDPMKR